MGELIDCDKDPIIPWKDFTVDEHRKGGQLEWDPAKVIRYLSPNQMEANRIKGYELHTELAHMPSMNANVLDYLLAHPRLIPNEWGLDEHDITQRIYFWGTVYRRSDGHLFVRCLRYRFVRFLGMGSIYRWEGDCTPVSESTINNRTFDRYMPAAILRA